MISMRIAPSIFVQCGKRSGKDENTEWMDAENNPYNPRRSGQIGEIRHIVKQEQRRSSRLAPSHPSQKITQLEHEI